MTDRNRETHPTEVQPREWNPACHRFKRTLAHDERQARKAEAEHRFAGRTCDHFQRGDRSQAVSDSGQTAQALRLKRGRGRGEEGGEQAASAGGQQHRETFAAPFVTQLAVQNEECARIEQQVINRHVHERMREDPPPFPAGNRARQKNEACVQLPEQQRNIQKPDQHREHPEFDAP